jgi:hypothetical protein
MSRAAKDVSKAKKTFDRFFRDDLYGRYHSDDNVILSRGIWSDASVKFPDLFRTDWTFRSSVTGRAILIC